MFEKIVSFIREAYPRTLLHTFSELTGRGPYAVETWRDLDENQRNKILNEISVNPQIVRDLLRLKAGLSPLIFGLSNNDGRYGRQITGNVELRNKLQ